MFKRVDFITKITYPNLTTYYFFNKEGGILLPVEIHNYNPQYSFPTPQVIISTLLNTIKATYLQTSVYLFQDKKYYCYLKIKDQNNKIFDINSNFVDSIEMAIYEQKPIMVLSEILYEQGLNITREMLNDALKSSVNPGYTFEC